MSVAGNGKACTMFHRRWLLVVGFALLVPICQTARAEETRRQSPQRLVVDSFFAEEVWAKVGERNCLKCHKTGGEASDSKFLLQRTPGDRKSLSHNREAFSRMADAQGDGKSRLLVKATGGLDHGGGLILKTDSTEYRILERFVRGLSKATQPSDKTELAEYDPRPFFEGVQMVSPERLLRRLTLSLAARLPSVQERAAVKERGMQAMDGVLDQLMKEDAFYERLKEGFNDILLMLVPDNGKGVLSSVHFQGTRS